MKLCDEKGQTVDIYPLRHNARRGNVIYMCRFKSVTASAAHVYSAAHRKTRVGHAMFDKYLHVANFTEYLKAVHPR